MFIGPTSQAPRIDEARNDSVYEIEIAFREMERRTKAEAGHVSAVAGGPAAAQSAGRRDRKHASRGVLHRQAVFARQRHRPAGIAGDARLRNAAARAHEPDPAVAAARAGRALLEEALCAGEAGPLGYRTARSIPAAALRVARFRGRDDRDWHAAGYPFQARWFAPHFEFRFPKYGDFASRGIDVELRGALEPWHVMGEEGATGGTVRYVDSSLERLQVKVDRPGAGSLRADLQRHRRAAPSDGHRRRICRRRALPRVAAAVGVCIRRSACTRR